MLRQTPIFALALQHLQQLIKQVNEVAIKFEIQLKQLFDAHTTPENNEPLQLRIKKAAEYFNSQLAMILNVIQTSPASTDSKQHATLYNEMLLQLFHSILHKPSLNCFNCLNNAACGILILILLLVAA